MSQVTNHGPSSTSVPAASKQEESVQSYSTLFAEKVCMSQPSSGKTRLIESLETPAGKNEVGKTAFSRDLEKENLHWKAMVESCSFFHRKDDENDTDYTVDFYTSRSPIFNGVVLGGIQAYQSLDPEFFEGNHRFKNILSHHAPNDEQIEKIWKADPYCCSKDNIRYVLSITDFPRGQGCMQFNRGFVPHLPDSIKRLHVPVGDGSWELLEKCLPDIFRFLDDARFHRAEGEAILVHCTAGMSRSATVLTAYLHHCFNGEVSINAILNYLKSKRPIVDPSSTLIEGLKSLEKKRG